MRDRTDGNKIHTRGGDGTNGFQSDAAARFGLRATTDQFYRRPQLRRGHVIKEEDVRTRISRLRDLRERVGLNFHFQFWKFLSSASDGGGNGVGFGRSQSDKMVVLDQNHVEQTEAMIFPAAASHGVFLKAPPTRRGLARVENFCRRASHRVRKLRRGRSHTAQPLNKIKRDTLGAQDSPRGTGYFQQGFTSGNFLAVTREFLNFYFGRKLTERDFGKLNSRNDQRLAGVHKRDGLHICRNRGKRGHVAATKILGQGGADGAGNFGDGKFHAHKMTAN